MPLHNIVLAVLGLGDDKSGWMACETMQPNMRFHPVRLDKGDQSSQRREGRRLRNAQYKCLLDKNVTWHMSMPRVMPCFHAMFCVC